ncbi:hypothetical protein FKX85_08050 [Echinicola soli]|uniref:Uncharacterized protein n=1 Tax=Echinicola soli TaxID=2591634 RepID=A0A514CGP3_9BACT|nr:hypothetical protein [Echinicola soli]QDH78991.1 hypothetical protein FKX85_08050 [Echinicola soli]
MYADPKEAIRGAIRIAFEGKPRRRKNEIEISDLYQIIGAEIELERLRNLPSYKDFENAIRHSLAELGYLAKK